MSTVQLLRLQGVQLLTLHGVQLLRLHGVQLLRLHEETFLRNFYKKFSQEKRRFATRLPLGRRALAASGWQRTMAAASWRNRALHAPGWRRDECFASCSTCTLIAPTKTWRAMPGESLAGACELVSAQMPWQAG
jgi:hypothetical protein